RGQDQQHANRQQQVGPPSREPAERRAPPPAPVPFADHTFAFRGAAVRTVRPGWVSRHITPVAPVSTITMVAYDPNPSESNVNAQTIAATWTARRIAQRSLSNSVVAGAQGSVASAMAALYRAAR